ncbi:hypothetical protein PUNSTDRAFT_123504 [Punctularia strigosozonata HHB-11173 SS5]|uniref:uncharacterized protein n=1 Tax=Punctularia strigosozonata (strain HHB-11173) TaxID=741275 RepID=UPI0004417850|nr:uncharacterized protein PUNSTDRAFT_123504 [Punctularia strigosozonata HHB-11173 SS5]EIN13511.1 hypothetical protein PUNSTDRAFT_123504 [Punctularia strigosozonata HHB-11173 SS5]
MATPQPQPPPPSSPPLPPASATASATGQFAPRREFLRSPHTFSTFALLALSGAGLVRLCSFPQAVHEALRAHFDARKLTAGVREAPAQNLLEISLHGRPWATAKSIRSEKLLVEIMTVIFQHGYDFLSTIDYGREQDDRLAIAFSKPAPPPMPAAPGSRSGSPMPLTVAPLPPPATKPARVPIGISFASPTVLRVINPPLHSTPAILQAVRGAWPRGVVSEKKIDTSFEFRLKGYRWFQEDTFATDSLQHILALLSSLDAHGFALLASLSLANRSRIKDLWIFTGPSEQSSNLDSAPSTPNASRSDLRRPAQAHGQYRGSLDAGASSGGSSGSPGSNGPSRLAAVPPPYQNAAARSSGHLRSASEPATNMPPPRGSFAAARALLRKPGRASQTTVPALSNLSNSVRNGENAEDSPQRPMAALPPALSRTEEEPLRATLPSEVGSVVNMTGVGAGHNRNWDLIGEEDEELPPVEVQNPHPQASVIYATHGQQQRGTPSPREHVSTMRSSAGIEGSIAMYYQNENAALTPSMLYTHSPLDVHPRTPSPPRTPGVHTPTPPRTPGVHTPTPPLPGAGTFDEAFRSSSSPPDSTHPTTPSPPLLGPEAFRDTIRSSSPPRDTVRDSAFTLHTYKTHEIPIAWTGAGPEPRAEPQTETGRRPPLPSAYASTGPPLPGAWQPSPTPRNEKPQWQWQQQQSPHHLPPLVAQNASPSDAEPAAPTEKDLKERGRMPSPERKAVSARAFTPGVTSPTQNGRKSQAAEVGVLPAQPRASRRASDGWIVVDVDSPGDEGAPTRPGLRPRSSSYPTFTFSQSGDEPGRGQAAAKAIVIIDAVDAKAQKGSSGSAFKKLFSLRRTEAEGGKAAGKRRERSASRGRGSENEGQTQKATKGWYR